jgi:hypothetical protein
MRFVTWQPPPVATISDRCNWRYWQDFCTVQRRLRKSYGCKSDRVSTNPVNQAANVTDVEAARARPSPPKHQFENGWQLRTVLRVAFGAVQIVMVQVCKLPAHVTRSLVAELLQDVGLEVRDDDACEGACPHGGAAGFGSDPVSEDGKRGLLRGACGHAGHALVDALLVHLLKAGGCEGCEHGDGCARGCAVRY